MVTVITLVIIVAMSLFTNWPKCVSELVVQNEQEVWSTVCKPRGTPFALFFSLLAVIIIQVWAVYIAEMYRLRYKELKEENRRLVLFRKQPPKSYIDMLFIVEHPAFEDFYKKLMDEGMVGVDEGELNASNVMGDLIKVGLKPDYADYDLFWPTVVRDAEKEITPAQIDVNSLYPFTDYSLDYLRSCLATDGETFVSEAVLTETRFGKYQVKADLFTARTYNDYLQKLLRTVTTRMDRVGMRSRKPLPTLQINQADIVRLLDTYVRTRLFGRPFDPFRGSDWKILLSKNGIVTQHIVKEMSVAIHRMQENVMTSEAVVEKTWFSSVSVLRMRES